MECGNFVYTKLLALYHLNAIMLLGNQPSLRDTPPTVSKSYVPVLSYAKN